MRLRSTSSRLVAACVLLGAGASPRYALGVPGLQRPTTPATVPVPATGAEPGLAQQATENLAPTPVVVPAAEPTPSTRPTADLPATHAAAAPTNEIPAAPNPATAPAHPNLAPDQLFAKCAPSVVLVEVRDAANKAIGYGSGFFVSADGLLVTNHHVIATAASAIVRPTGAPAMEVEGVVAADHKCDLVLLKVRTTTAKPLRLNDGALPDVGTRVFAIGNPQGLTGTFSDGLVSGIRSDLQFSVIQTSAPISPGSSGGPLLTADGAVVGVTSSGITGGGNLNFAVPTMYVADLVKNRGAVRPLDVYAEEAARKTAEEDREMLRDMLARLDSGQTDSAIAGFKMIGDRGKRDPLYWYVAGRVHYQLNNLDNAELSFKESAKLGPKDANAAQTQVGLGNVARSRGKYAEALECYRNAAKLDPKSATPFVNAGVAQTMAGDYEKAVAAFDRALTLAPRDFQTHLLKARACAKAGKFREAYATLATAGELNPKSIEVPLTTGEAQLVQRQWEGARATFKRVVADNPDNARAYYGLGIATYNAGDRDDAFAALRNAARFDPEGPTGKAARAALKAPKTIPDIQF